MSTFMQNVENQHSPHSHPEHSGSEQSLVGYRSHSPPKPQQTHLPGGEMSNDRKTDQFEINKKDMKYVYAV